MYCCSYLLLSLYCMAALSQNTFEWLHLYHTVHRLQQQQKCCLRTDHLHAFTNYIILTMLNLVFVSACMPDFLGIHM